MSSRSLGGAHDVIISKTDHGIFLMISESLLSISNYNDVIDDFCSMSIGGYTNNMATKRRFEMPWHGSDVTF